MIANVMGKYKLPGDRRGRGNLERTIDRQQVSPQRWPFQTPNGTDAGRFVLRPRAYAMSDCQCRKYTQKASEWDASRLSIIALRRPVC